MMQTRPQWQLHRSIRGPRAGFSTRRCDRTYAMQRSSFTVNGEKLFIDELHQHISAAEYIRQFTSCKSVKIGCNEGGCGACAVELVQQDAVTGAEEVVAVNSCLLPVSALAGCHLITSEGLGNSRQGFNEVQTRLSGFHGTQCGFCSPGMTVACHAALSAAAAAQQVSESSSSDGDDAVMTAPLAADLLSSVDGNICRCTGWRPIADMIKSFCHDVDIEDLGLNSLQPAQLKPITQQQQLTPAACKQRANQQQHRQIDIHQQQQQHFDSSLLHLHHGSVLVPKSLQQLLAAVQAAQAAAVPLHILAGNTGSGLYKDQWSDLRSSVAVIIRQVPELQQLEVVDSSSSSSGSSSSMNTSPSPASMSPHILAGSAVTISRLLQTLKTLAAAAAAASSPTRQQQLCAVSLHFMIAYISRIAGTLVRNAATVGGHLMLVRSHHLESDLITIMMAAGAEVQITDVGGSAVWMTVEHFVSIDSSSSSNDDDPAAAMVSQLGSSALITAVRLPLPVAAAAAAVSSSSSSPVMWSHKVTVHRHGNEHAAVNISMWLSKIDLEAAAAAAAAAAVEDSKGNASSSRGSCCLRIALGTYQAENAYDSSSSSSSDGVWQCIRAGHVEAAVLSALQQQQSDVIVDYNMLYGALNSLPDLLSKDLKPAGRNADYVRSVTPALILKGLAVLLPQQQQQQQSSTAAAAAGSITTSTLVTSSLLSELRASTLAAAHPTSSSSSSSSSVLSSSSVHLPRGHQDIPSDLTAAPPLYWPETKEGSLVQCSGEAVYADDSHLATGALYAAYVTSKHPHARIIEVHWQEALKVEGVTGHVSAADVPAGPDCDVTGNSTLLKLKDVEPLFAHKVVQYVGQPIGLVLATTAAAAREGAARVTVEYQLPLAAAAAKGSTAGLLSQECRSTLEKQPDNRTSNGLAAADDDNDDDDDADDAASPLPPAITTLAAAVAADSWMEMPQMMTPKLKAQAGDVSSSLSLCYNVLRGEVMLSSQRHLYMEPQTAVATPGEAGTMTVISSCQGTDQILHGVCRVLGCRHADVHVTCHRVGGGFGGKVDRAVFPAAAAAVAAHKFRRQVRLVVSGATDGCMTAGRCPITVNWTAGLDQQHKLQAVKMDVLLLGGAYLGSTTVEAASIAHNLESVYHIPAFDVQVRVARANLPPRSTVRAPGKISATLIIETVLQHVAAAAGQSPERFREQLMIKIPDEVLKQAAQAEAEAAVGDHYCNGICNGSSSSSSLPVIPHPKYYNSSSATSGPAAAAAAGCDGGGESVIHLCTTLNKQIALHTYTLPYMWQQLQLKCDYQARRAAVDEFNKCHQHKKRGLALVPVRFETFQSRRVSSVTLYSDGSVLVLHPGTEMGQGIGTKVKQTAAACLGALLPPGQAGLLLDYIRIATASTQLLPHSGVAAGSTTSEAATAAVAAACDILIERLTPAADKINKEAAAAAADRQNGNSSSSGAVDGAALWEKIIKEVAEPSPVMTSKVVMSATALAGFADHDSGIMMYQSFGVAAAEVEVDCCTGERRLMKADIMFDAGRSISPAVDLGQVEGAFMMGVGHVLHEEVVEDEETGRNVTNTTWEYKPPGLAELPQVFNVHMLRDSPVHVPVKRQLSAKATGEPPMLMAAAVACALQDAVAAAWNDYEQRHQQAEVGGMSAEVVKQRPSRLQLPGTTVNLLKMLPPMW